MRAMIGGHTSPKMRGTAAPTAAAMAWIPSLPDVEGLVPVLQSDWERAAVVTA